ncbi:hypothetical protein GOV09_01290 [Candidatus Woesearchaeota archaeon]|nr:hypothetical protein [Candidatus Woesearchaeota archaeon]
MTISFKYKAVSRPDGTQVKTPSIPVTLRGKEIFETIALVDSGADISAISQDLAEILGIRLSGAKSPAFGIGGKVDSVETNMGISIQKGHERYSFQMPVKVILGKYDFPVLLGRTGFFEKFVISFDESQEKISLKRIIRR